MTERIFGRHYGGSAPEAYQRFFVPAIGAPLAAALVDVAAPEPGERVLDVACGTGVVARLVAGRVGAKGRIVGLDANPGMLAVARGVQADGASIEWCEASAEKLPFSDHSFDLVTCQMGLQFVPDRALALREQHRVLVSGGRLALNVPGPTPVLFQTLAESLARHIDPKAAGFVNAVFSLHDPGDIRALVTEAGFDDVRVDVATAILRLPPAPEFMWQYIRSTPLANLLEGASERQLEALERDVTARGRAAEDDGGVSMELSVTTATARA